LQGLFAGSFAQADWHVVSVLTISLPYVAQ
jgi:hypothetical protein